MSDEHTNVDDQIQQLTDRIDVFRKQCHWRSASRVSRELRSLAKSEGRIVPFLLANFYLMNDAQSLLEPAAGADYAVESIAYLESEEKARQFQPDLPDEYFSTVQWMSSCSYDNLAKHVADREGYNSDGVHDCINEGIQVCRRTGKMECVTCFREYATDVYKASDDLEMAQHHARYVATHETDGDNDRRYVGNKELTWLLLVSGHLEAAWDSVLQTAKVAGTFHNPLSSRRETRRLMDTVLHLQGRAAEIPHWAAELELPDTTLEPMPQGENPGDDSQWDLCRAVAACCAGDHAAAIQLLTPWDRLLRERECIDRWFEFRLRLIAVFLLQGDRKKAEALGEQLAARAKPSRDFFTLRRLKLMLSGEVLASPIAAVGTLSSGPFSHGTKADSGSEPAADTAPAIAVESAGEATAEPAPQEEDDTLSPLWGRIRQLQEKMQQSGGEQAVLNGLLDDLLQLPPADVTDPRDASWFLYLGHVLAHSREGGLMDLWKWGNGFVARFPQHAGVLNLTADLADSARRTVDGEAAADQIATLERVESLFRQSLDLDPDHGNNFARAGAFYLSQGKIGEAERCFARGFRLNREDSRMALSLAEIYSNTDRPRDALTVLDMCIREGCSDAMLFWQAGLAAFGLSKYDVMVTYFDKFEELEPGQPWTNYYRATGLLELEHPDKALLALDQEDGRSPDAPLPVAGLRAWAYGQLRDVEALETAVDTLLKIPFASAEYLTLGGLSRICGKVFDVIQQLPRNSSIRRQLEERLLQTGLAPDELFEAHREDTPTSEGLNYYIVSLRQDLNEMWAAFPGCLPGQADWPAYECRWGVLADTEEAAAETVLRWQRRCFPVPAEVEDVAQQGDGYTDHPGIVWQSAHMPVDDFEGEDEDDADEVEGEEPGE